MRAAAETLRDEGVMPFAAYCSDPCDGRTQGTVGMFDSLPYRNDAAIVMRRLIRSLPSRAGVMGIATCDKGLPATMLALAGCRDLPGIVVPGGVTLPAIDAEDAGKVQSIGARFAHGLISVDDAADDGLPRLRHAGRRLSVPGHGGDVAGRGGGLRPDAAAQRARAVGRAGVARARRAVRAGARAADVARDRARADPDAARPRERDAGARGVWRIDEPAAAHPGDRARGGAAAARRSTDWTRVNRAMPRLVDALPNGPRNHPTVQVFMAGGVPEVMLHLRDMGLLHLDAMTVTGETLGANLDWWEASERRRGARARLRESDGVDPDRVIMSPDAARRAGLTTTVVFPVRQHRAGRGRRQGDGHRSVGGRRG